MRALTQQEVAAAWLYHEKFCAMGVGATEFYRHLSNFERNRINEMIRDILAAEPVPDEVIYCFPINGIKVSLDARSLTSILPKLDA